MCSLAHSAQLPVRLHHPIVKSRNRNIIIVLLIIFYDRRYSILYPDQSILVTHTGTPQLIIRNYDENALLESSGIALLFNLTLSVYKFAFILP